MKEEGRSVTNTFVRIVAQGSWSLTPIPHPRPWIVRVVAGSTTITSKSNGSMLVADAGDYVVVPDGSQVIVADRAGRKPFTRHTIAPQGLARYGSNGPLTELMVIRASSSIAHLSAFADVPPPAFRLDVDSGTAAAFEAAFGLLEHERDRAQPGAEMVTSRLAEVLTMHALRAGAADDGPPNLLRLLQHPQLAQVAQAMYDDLARPWTVASLAREARMSRTSFAAAFRSTSGESPLGLLRQWRIRHAQRLLRETSLTLSEIAGFVGYESAPSFSRAFVNQEGVKPGAWRGTARGMTSQQIQMDSPSQVLSQSPRYEAAGSR